jgi:dipeptidyl aminopeptidase/acylaminoacyl peptidase
MKSALRASGLRRWKFRLTIALRPVQSKEKSSMRRIGLLLVLMAVAGAPARSHPLPQSAGAPFTLEQIFSFSFPTELVAAPRGNRLAWVFNTRGRRNIWVASCPGACADPSQFVARQLTRFQDDDGQDITELRFSANGNWIVFVRGGNKNDAGEVPNPTSDVAGAEQSVWVVSWAGGTPRKIGAGRNPAVSAGGFVAFVRDNKIWSAPLAVSAKPREIVARGSNGSPTWSPDGRKLAFASNRGSHAFIALYDPMKRTLSYVSPSYDRDANPRWAPDGRRLAFVRRPARMTAAGAGGPAGGGFGGGGPWSIMVAELAGKAREVWRSADPPLGNPPNMAGDALLNWATSDRLVFASEHTGWMQLYSVAAQGGAVASLMRGDCEFEHMTFSAGRRDVIFTSNCATDARSRADDVDRRHLWRVSAEGTHLELLTPGTAIQWAPVATGDGKWIAYVGSDARQPAMPFVRPAGGGAGTMLAAAVLPKNFPAAALVDPQQAIVTSPDGVTAHNQLFLPAACSASAKCPAVIFMHGGPMRQMFLGWHNRGYYHRAYAFNQYLASRGYVLLSVNYRSGIGYGRAFREAENRGANGASEYQEIVAAATYLQQRPEVDAARIGLWGGSYGGYLTALGLARNSELFAAGVDLHGVHDWSQRGGLAGNLSGERARIARDSSPIAAVDKWRSPVLLVHGDDDRNVDFNQTVDLVARLRRQGVVFEELVYPDEVHDFLLFRNWMEILKTSADFFERHLKNRK